MNPVRAETQYVIDSLDGEITKHEVETFISAVAAQTIPTSQWAGGTHNQLADGEGGLTLEGINDLYAAISDVPSLGAESRQLLNLVIKWNDAWLTHRNDQPLGEHRVMWTGKVEPVWPPDTPPSQYAGCEVGDTVGHLAYTALNIANTPSIWHETVPDGDPHHFGISYLERAKTYVTMLEVSMSMFFTKNFIDPETHEIRPPASNEWVKQNENVDAWNRQMMFLHAYQTLGQIHQVLKDDAALAGLYKNIVTVSTDAFVKNAQPRKAPDGTPVYAWGYGNMGDVKGRLTGESIGHGQYDIWGLTRAYRAGYTNVTQQQMKTYADTVVRVIRLGNDSYSGTVDRSGRESPSNYLYQGYFYLSPYNPQIYKPAANAAISSRVQSASAGMTATILWTKHMLNTAK
jgi:hypothetical protein